MNEILFRKVRFVPRDLEPGVLYVSEEFQVAVHLCACGCGSRVALPLGPAEWSFDGRGDEPTLRPSVGNGQLPCNSHYLIDRGRIVWMEAMTPAQALAAMRSDQRRREAHYRSLESGGGLLARLWRTLLHLLGWS